MQRQASRRERNANLNDHDRVAQCEDSLDDIDVWKEELEARTARNTALLMSILASLVVASILLTLNLAGK